MYFSMTKHAQHQVGSMKSHHHSSGVHIILTQTVCQKCEKAKSQNITKNVILKAAMLFVFLNYCKKSYFVSNLHAKVHKIVTSKIFQKYQHTTTKEKL